MFFTSISREEDNATHAEKATVEVRVNGQLSESLRPLPPQAEGDMQCRFNISGKFSPGDVVRIDALTDDGQYHAWAEVTVPQRPNEITDIDTVTVPLTQYYYTQNYLRYKINIKDRPNENNFYRLIMDKQMTVKDYNNEIGELCHSNHTPLSFYIPRRCCIDGRTAYQQR